MPKKFVCMNYGDNFITTDPTYAREHVADNPTHNIIEIDEDDYGNVEVTKIEITEERET